MAILGRRFRGKKKEFEAIASVGNLVDKRQKMYKERLHDTKMGREVGF